MRQHSICYHSAGAYNEFGTYTYAYYISPRVEFKNIFVMNEVNFLKVGGAGGGNRPQHLANNNIYSPANFCA